MPCDNVPANAVGAIFAKPGTRNLSMIRAFTANAIVYPLVAQRSMGLLLRLPLNFPHELRICFSRLDFKNHDPRLLIFIGMADIQNVITIPAVKHWRIEPIITDAFTPGVKFRGIKAEHLVDFHAQFAGLDNVHLGGIDFRFKHITRIIRNAYINRIGSINN